MADPINDDVVSRRYRELAPEEPPRALDETILAASRRAVSARPAPPQSSSLAPTGRQRWRVPLAAAAVIVLSIGLTLRMQLERPGLEDVTPANPQVLKTPKSTEAAKAAGEKTMAAAPAEEKPQAASSTSEHFRLRSEAESAGERRDRPAGRSRQQANVPQPFKLEAPARSAPAQQADSREAESQVMRAPAAGARSARGQESPPPYPVIAAPAPAPQSNAASPSQAIGGAQQGYSQPRSDDTARTERSVASGALAKRTQEKDADMTPEKALERIAELRKAGKHDEADKALAEFRKRFPEYKIPDKTLERVERR